MAARFIKYMVVIDVAYRVQPRRPKSVLSLKCKYWRISSNLLQVIVLAIDIDTLASKTESLCIYEPRVRWYSIDSFFDIYLMSIHIHLVGQFLQEFFSHEIVKEDVYGISSAAVSSSISFCPPEMTWFTCTCRFFFLIIWINFVITCNWLIKFPLFCSEFWVQAHFSNRLLLGITATI